MYLGNRGLPDDGLRDVYAKEMMDPIGGGGSASISLNPEPILKILPALPKAIHPISWWPKLTFVSASLMRL